MIDCKWEELPRCTAECLATLWGRILKTFLRMAIALVQAISVWGVLHCIPRKEVKVITAAGRRWLVHYIFHVVGAVPISLVVNSGPLGSTSALWLGQLMTCFLTAATSVFWTSKAVWKVLGFVVNPPVPGCLGKLFVPKVLSLPHERQEFDHAMVELTESPRSWQGVASQQSVVPGSAEDAADVDMVPSAQPSIEV